MKNNYIVISDSIISEYDRNLQVILEFDRELEELCKENKIVLYHF